MGGSSTKCRSCENYNSNEDDAAGLPGVSIVGSTDYLSNYDDSPTQKMSDVRSSDTSPAFNTGSPTAGEAEEDVEWLQKVSPMMGVKNASEFKELCQQHGFSSDELSVLGGGTIDGILDAEQEELNREELRVERVSKRISQKKLAANASKSTAEKMVRNSIRQLKDLDVEGLKAEVEKFDEATSNAASSSHPASVASNLDTISDAEDEKQEKQRRSLQKNITKAIAFDHGAVGTDQPEVGEGRLLRKNLRRTASNLSLMSTMGRDVSERLKIIVENPRAISAFYDLDSVDIGRGSYGAVKRAKVKSTGATRAVKVISKDQCKEGFGALKNEIFISKKVDHPNVVKLYEIFEDSENLYLVLELCAAGHLFAYIRAQRGPLRDNQSVLIMRQILRGVSYLHSSYIVHRDLKPQNVLVARPDISRDGVNSLRISDFGLSCEFEEGQILTAQVGTTAYMAPQVLMKQYNHLCDVWSCGVILHILLSGFLPFLGQNASKESIRKAILRGKLKMTGRRWAEVNQGAVKLMLKMLRVNADERLSARNALEHPWLKISRQREEPQVLSKEEVVEGLQTMYQQNVFKRAALHVIVTMLNDEQTSIPRDTFMKLDGNGDGLISQEELRDFYGDCSDLDSTMFKDEGISYTQFLAATFDKRQWVSRQVCRAAFTQFDSNGDEHLTLQELVSSNSLLGRLNPSDAEQLVKDFDTNQDGMIDFHEFYSMMRPNRDKLGLNRSASMQSASVQSIERQRTRSDHTTTSSTRSGNFWP